MDKLRLFVKTSAVFFAGNVLSKLIGFLLLPLYTNRLTPDQFGSYDLNFTILNLVIPIIFFQIWDGLYRFGFEKTDTGEKYATVSNSYFSWFLSLVLYAVIYLITRQLFTLQDGLYVFVYGILIAAGNQYFYVARVFMKNSLLVITGVINCIIVALLNIVLITIYNIGVESLYISSISGFFVQVLIIEIALHPIKSFKLKYISKNGIQQMLKFTVPLSLSSVVYWFFEGFTKLSISIRLGTYSNGLYAVANRFSSIIIMFFLILQYAWNEMAYIMANEDDRVYKYETGIGCIFVIAIICSSAFILAVKLVFPIIIDETYKSALELVPIAIIGATANAYANFLSVLFLAEKKTKWLLVTALPVGFVNIVAQLALNLLLDLRGFIIVLCVSFLLLAAIRIYAMQKVLKLKLPKRNYLYILLLLVSLSIYYSINSNMAVIIYILLLGVVLLISLRGLLKVMLNGRELKGQKEELKDLL